jgi:MFS family permease
MERIVARGQAQGELRTDVDPRLAAWISRRYRGDPHRWVLGQLPDATRTSPGPSARSWPWSSAASASTAHRPLRDGAAQLVWLLGLGAFGLAFSITTTAAYLPPLLAEFTDSQTVIAALLAAEGLFALTVPLVIGPWSDTFQTPMGRRRPFMLAAIGPMGFCLALMAFMPNIWTTALIVMAFFFAYYVYEPPYRGLYPDVLHEDVFGRSQGVQHILRGIALGVALVGGGFLLKLWDPAPFLLAAAATTLACGAVVRYVKEDGGEAANVYKGIRAYVRMS